jgi:hypothetical protein
MSDWFSSLFGFREGSPDNVRAHLEVHGETLRSRANGASFGIGTFETPSVAALREAASALPLAGASSLSHAAVADVLALHALPENRDALFQVASQFNALEFMNARVTPEAGVTDYIHDLTQGPACALAAAPATVYRNHLLPLDRFLGPEEGHHPPGQRADRQLDLLSGLAEAFGPPPLWRVQNGYTFASEAELEAISARIAASDREALLGHLRIGVARGVEVVFASRPRGELVRVAEAPGGPPRVSQALCSALSVSYAGGPLALWEPWARLVLDAAYEATLLTAALDRAAGLGSGRVWLTFLGGGEFGNAPAWIHDAIGRAFQRTEHLGLDVRVAHYRGVSTAAAEAIDAASGLRR